jgi:hypothetical protein
MRIAPPVSLIGALGQRIIEVKESIMRSFNLHFRNCVAAVGGLCASVALSACGVDGPEATTTETSALTGSLTISGVVSDTSGLTVEGVKVTLNGTAQATAITNLQGQYSFSVNPGSYSVSPSGFCGSFQPNVVNLNNLTASTTVNFTGSGGFCSATTFSGGTSGSLKLSGHVTSAGHAVPGVKVTLAGSTTGFRFTDQTGAYSFSVNPGSYSLQASGGCSTFTPNVANLNNLTTSRTQDFQGSGNCPIAPLAMCPQLDLAFIGESLGSACDLVSTPDCAFTRAETWDNTIVIDFATAISNDCRFGQWSTGLLTEEDVVDYLNDLLGFTLYFYGCPATGTVTGPLDFGLIPAALASRTFTTADLAALSAAWSAAIAQALSDNGSPPLSAAQVNAINAQLAFLASRVPGTVNSPKFTFSTCP